MKRKKLILAIMVLLLLGVAVRFVWIAMLSASADTSGQSTDKRYTAKVSSKWRTPFWGGAYDHHDITIVSAEGRQVRHIILDEPSNAWPQECSIRWATDSSSVTFVFQTEELEKTRLFVNVSP